jgi:hypothetical protein
VSVGTIVYGIMTFREGVEESMDVSGFEDGRVSVGRVCVEYD